MSQPLRFVVLHHTGIKSPHFDLMFELEIGDEKLTSLRCPRWPIKLGDRLEETGEHRCAYLTYEGPVSNDRGTVKRVDEGTLDWRMILNDPFTIALTLRSIEPTEIVIALRSKESAFDVQSVA
ncbi:MAG TPA: hypothetical protein PK402_10425 [Tepidisphaeraceae bacterium]|nr:hypothetical protein [Tepidisphaeraceae bacterium]